MARNPKYAPAPKLTKPRPPMTYAAVEDPALLSLVTAGSATSSFGRAAGFGGGSAAGGGVSAIASSNGGTSICRLCRALTSIWVFHVCLPGARTSIA
jgi:hypothetical protein